MRKMKLLISCLIVLLSTSTKAEDLFEFYFHQINLDEYPTVKVIGVIELYRDGHETHEELNGGSWDLRENDSPVSDLFLNYLKANEKYVIFEMSYKSTLPKDRDRKLSAGDESRSYYFNQSQGLFIPPESYQVTPIGFIPGAKSLMEEYLTENLSVPRYVLSRAGIELKQELNRESETLGLVRYGEMINISKKKYGHKEYTKDIFPESLTGYWRKVTYQKKEGFILDTYLSRLPARVDKKPLKDFLESSFGKAEFIGDDYRGDSLMQYGNNVVYNESQLFDYGSIYFNALLYPEIYIVAKDWFYNEKSHVLKKIESNAFHDKYLEFRDMFNVVDFEIGNDRARSGSNYIFCAGMAYGIRYFKNKHRVFKDLLCQVTEYHKIKCQDIRTSKIIDDN